MLLKIRRSIFAAILLVVALQMQAEYLTSLDQVTTGYYRVYSLAYGTTMAMSETTTGSNNVFCDTPEDDDYMQVWYIDVLSTSGSTKNVQLMNAVSGRWIDRAGKLIQTYENHSSTPFVIAHTEDGFTIARGNGFHHQQSGHDVVSYGTDAVASKWQLEEVTIDEAALAAQQAEYNGYITLVNNKATITTALTKYFTDNSCSELKTAYQSYSDGDLTTAMQADGIPQTVIDMALKVKNAVWAEYQSGWSFTEKTFRIGSYAPVSKESVWRSIVKVGYALSPNSDPTGIYVKAGDIITVYVGDIPNSGSVMLRNVPVKGASGDGFALTSGFNILKMQANGCLFVDYEVDNTTNGAAPYTAMNTYPNVTIHIEGGLVNGCFSATRGDTDADWAIMQEKLFKQCEYLQLRSRKQIFNMNAEKVMTACPVKMVELLNEWDKVVEMEHNIMGLDAEFPGYFNTPMMAVSFTGDGHMFASTYGTYYKESTLSDVMKYENLFAGGSLWGPAHEIGHINQAAINIIGQSEVSNNLFSNIAVYLNGHLTSRTEYISTTFQNMANNVYWPDRPSLWERTHLYFQLYQFFHVQGYKPTFYQDLFKALRADPCTRVQNTFIDATYDYLKFYKKCCEVSGYDLTEFFQAYGFFVVPTQQSYTVGSETRDAFKVGDYGTYYLVVTQEMIDAAIAEVKAMNLKKTNIIFIEDRVSAPDATYEGAEEGAKKTTFSGYSYGHGDVGQYTDFVSTVSASGYKVSYVEDTEGDLDVLVKQSGTGAVGFKVYDADGKLVYLSNTYEFSVPKAVYSQIKNTAFRIVAAGPDGNDEEMPYDTDFIEWVVKDTHGEVLTKHFQAVVDGEEISAYPSALNAAFVELPALTSFTYQSSMTAKEKERVVLATLSVPFRSSSETQGIYYYVKVRNGYLYQSDTTPAITKTSQDDPLYKWAFYGNPYKGYSLRNLATGQWLCVDNNSLVMKSADLTYWVITDVTTTATPDDFLLGLLTSNPNQNRNLNDGGGNGNNLILYNDNSSEIVVSEEAIMPMPTTTINLSSHLSSFSYPSPLVVPEDVNIFVATNTYDNTLVVQWLDTKVIPANTGVLLYSDGGGNKILQLGAWVDDDVTDLYSGNLLTGTSSTSYTVAAGDNIYALRNGVTAFAKVNVGVEIPIQKAYIKTSNSSARFLEISFGDETTALKLVNCEDRKVDSGIYDLQGRKVSNPTKGLYIVNGKKVVIK